MKSFLLAMSFVLLVSGCQTGTKDKSNLNTNTNQAAPKSEVLKVDEVVKAFQAARLPLGQLEFFNANSDPDKLLGKPNQYTGKVFWQTKKDMTHGIESFANEADLQTRKKFFETDQRFSGDFLYTHKNILVHIHKDLLPETAAKYEQTLKSL
jgi:hypothetical protein